VAETGRQGPKAAEAADDIEERANGEGRGRDRRQRRRLPVGRRREELIEAALRLFSTSPVDQISMDDIADEAHASRALVYHYFGSKQDLYLAAVHSAAEQLAHQLVIRGEMSARERLTRAVSNYLDFARDYAPSFLALLRGGGPGAAYPELGTAVEQVRDLITAGLLEILHADQPTPILMMTARAWTAVVESASLDWLENKEIPRPDLDRLLIDQLDAMLRAAARYDPAMIPLVERLVGGDSPLAAAEG
jgi:AcrR family transcriptional regulator